MRYIPVFGTSQQFLMNVREIPKILVTNTPLYQESNLFERKDFWIQKVQSSPYDTFVFVNCPKKQP